MVLSWCFLAAAVLHLGLMYYTPAPPLLDAVGAKRNILLAGILCALIAGVLRL